MMDGRYFADGALSCNWFDIVDPNVILSLPAVVGAYRNYINRFIFAGTEYFVRFTVREIGNDSSVHASTISEVAVYAKTEDARLDSHPENPEDEHTASFIDHKIAYYLNAVKAVPGRNSI